ncbi:hypothetical protein LTR36_006219 [Oleoguttula mirabilis]|uniref:DUF7730 domain-containing protein n=1 Tax=Oleoguttula mirabilis TaxID=1507867 RepID=A0AAV9JE15_9PEZI|nr:hypothetical protein LTR36_006219 [Oleoguttula mirabilis]
MVLGNMTIHFTGWKGKLRHTICHTGTDDRAFAEEIKTSNRGDSKEDYSHRHEGCRLFGVSRHNPKKLQLSVLQACRAIHKEAALMPYQDNSFSFAIPGGFELLLKTLVPAQARAIRSIVVNDMRDGGKAFAMLVQNKLHGLKHITVFVAFLPRSSARSFYDAKATGDIPYCSQGLVAFARLPLASATIAAYNYRTGQYTAPDVVAKPDLVEWAAGLEERLMTPWDQATFEQRSAASGRGGAS